MARTLGPGARDNSPPHLESFLGALIAQHTVTALPKLRDERAGARSAGILENDLLQDSLDVLAATRDPLVLFVSQIPDLPDGAHLGVLVRLDHLNQFRDALFPI